MGALGALIGLIDKGATIGIQMAGDQILLKSLQYAKRSVELFYNSYAPSVPWNGEVYARQGGLYGSYFPVDSGGGLVRTVGVNFPGTMGGGHRLDNGTLFDFTWENGFHGNPNWSTTVRTMPPKVLMDALFNMLKGEIPGILMKEVATGMHSVGL